MTRPVSDAGSIRLVGVRKEFGLEVAVQGLDLEIRPGEFFALLGSSGCGKTTTLRMVAGFEQPTSGRVELDGVDVSALPPHQRDVRTVFQSYALFPHLDVQRNVAFGLTRMGVRGEELDRRVRDALAMVKLEGLGRRKPSRLSGGQQQRVALARALVCRPAVLLLDEPLGALDARLRKDLQVELKALQEQVGTTFVYVTHDQDEALTMADRVAVMNKGRLEQVDAPSRIYEEPATGFVADFLGDANVVPLPAATAEPRVAGVHVAVGFVSPRSASGTPSVLVVRPERVRLCVEPGAGAAVGPNRLPARVERTVYRGVSTTVMTRLSDGTPLEVTVPTGAGAVPATGDAVVLHLPPEALRVVPATAAA